LVCCQNVPALSSRFVGRKLDETVPRFDRHLSGGAAVLFPA
jgi:hypothetical protein